jgi:hypothetical protein
MTKTPGALLLAAVFLAGCGGSGAVSGSLRQEMNAKFVVADTNIATMESFRNTANLETATQHYIALVHQYADELGPAEAKRRLVSEGDKVGGYCPPCKQMFYDAARRY